MCPNDILPTTFTTDVTQGIGVHIQATDSLGVQTILLFGTGSFTDTYESESGVEGETSATITTFGAEVAVPYYFWKNEDVSIYSALGFRYNGFAYEDEFESDGYWATEYNVLYWETNMLLQLGGQANFGNFSIFSSYGIGVNFTGYLFETEPSEPLQEPKTKRTVTGAGFTTNQLSIGLIYFVK